MKSASRLFLSIALAVVVAAGPALAGKPGVRSSARNNVNSNKNVNVNQNKNVNRNTNVNVNQNKNVNIDVDIDHHGGHYGGCCYHDYHPVAAVAGAIVTAAVIGSMVTTLPPSCSTVILNGFAYQQCGSTWYQPQISGSSTTYIVVNQPR
jgi:hypothetical protein